MNRNTKYNDYTSYLKFLYEYKRSLGYANIPWMRLMKFSYTDIQNKNIRELFLIDDQLTFPSNSLSNTIQL